MGIPIAIRQLLTSRQWKLSTYQVLVLGFIALILLGTALLMSPFATVSGNSLRFVDALFTATSAVCVTGLVVVDTGTYFSIFGQSVIILLIQAGGLGVMTVATLIAVLSGKKINLKERLLIQEATSQIDLAGVVRLTLYIIKATILLEFIGGTLLAFRLYQDFGLRGVYLGYWHAVSAFCNAGFDLFGDYRSLTQYVDDLTVNLVVACLIVAGGLGFPVIADIWNYRQARHFSLHSKVVISASLLLIMLGTLFICAAEYTNGSTLGSLSLGEKLMSGAFLSVTARTAGYNTLDTGSLREGTQLIVIILMFIGASPSSMGGGVKTTTAAILAIALIGSITGKKDPHIFFRQIPQQIVYKAFTVVSLSAMLIILVTVMLSFTETIPVIKLLFEAVSAFGTVGLSTGITPALSSHGKLLIIVTMFAGRVGTLTLLMALALKVQKVQLRYPEGKIIIS